MLMYFGILRNRAMKERNKDNAKYCKGCAWLHIGVKVDHNHCDYDENDKQYKRANGHTSYTGSIEKNRFELEEYLTPSICRWFWDKKIAPNPSMTGILYKAPNSDKCPKIPIVQTKAELERRGWAFRG